MINGKKYGLTNYSAITDKPHDALIHYTVSG